MLALLILCLSVFGRSNVSSVGIQNRADPNFLPGALLGHVTGIEDVSGLCASRTNPNILFAHSNKGDGPNIYAISSLTGELKKTFHVTGAHNHDWEDIACGPCGDKDGGDCIYIGDIGDHGGDGARNIIYKIREPSMMDFEDNAAIESEIRIIWNPPQQDSETLMVDPKGNLYIISKVSNGQGQVGRIDSSVWNTSSIPVTVSNLTTLPLSTGHSDPTGGDISPDGREVIILTHRQVFHWQIVDGNTVKDTLALSPIDVPFHINKHVDSVAWDVTGRGYYTISEGSHDALYYYARN